MSKPRPSALADNKRFRVVTVSQLCQWLICPLSFRFRYVEGIVPPLSPKMFLTSSIRACLGEYYRRRQRHESMTAVELGQWLHENWSEAALRQGLSVGSTQEEMALQRQALALTLAYLREAGANEPAPLVVTPYWRAPIVDPDSNEDVGIVLAGGCDLVLPAKDGPLLVNFRVCSRSPPQLEILHEIRLTAASLLFRRVIGETESAVEIRNLIHTKTPRILFHGYPRRSPQHFRRLLAALRAFRAAAESGNHFYRPTWLCTSCDYRDHVCPDWDPGRSSPAHET